MKMLRLDSELLVVTQYERDRLHALGFDEIDEINGDTPEEIIEHGRDADMVMVMSNYLPERVIESFEKCIAIIRRGTGCDKISIPTATKKGILVANLPAFAIEDVADHAMMLLLALARKLPYQEKALASRDWVNMKKPIYNFPRITGKTVGLVGFGHIGKCIARRCRGFDMRILDHHRHVDPEEEARYGATPVDLETLLRESDFVILCCPQTKETRGMLGKEQFAMMKKTAFLINVGRGAVTDEEALAEAVKNGVIAGAGIDVFEHLNLFASPEGQGPCYYDGIEGIITTPHSAANTAESTRESIDKAMEQIERIVTGHFPSSWVNPEVKDQLRDRYKD